MIEIDKATKEQRNKKYNDWARKRPAYISMAVPVIVGIVCGIADIAQTQKLYHAVVYVSSIAAISTSLFFFYRFFLRDLSKLYPGIIIFNKRIKPTTKLLYASDGTFSEETKTEIRRKIKEKKHIDLQSIKKKDHSNPKYVKRVDEAVAWLLEVTRFDDILFEYNCIFGFYRNLTAALLIDALLLFALTAINHWLFTITFGRVYLYGGIVLILSTILTSYLSYVNGIVYAKKLYNVFLCLDDNPSNY